MFLIILSHVSFHSGVNVFGCTSNEITVAFFSYAGQIGNGIFIFAICWFSSEKFNLKKIIKLILQTLFYSYVFLILFIIFKKESVNFVTIVKSVFPIAFASNWFVTAYILFSILAPYLHSMVNNISKENHIRLLTFFLIIYCIVPSFFSCRYFINEMSGFFLIFLITSFIKKYNIKLKTSNDSLILLSILTCVCWLLFIIIFNNAANKIPILYGKTMFWLFYNSLPMLAINFNLFIITKRSKTWSNTIINRLSSLSLGMYLIHENKLLVGNGFYEWIYDINDTRLPMVIYCIFAALIIFITVALIEYIRSVLFDGLFNKVSAKLEVLLTKKYKAILNIIKI